MASNWHTYTTREIETLARTGGGLTDEGEQLCPACGHRTVRRYLHEHQGPQRTVRMSYVWCSNCHRYSSSTGPSIASIYEFDDPGETSAELRALRDSDLFGLLDHLDALWDAGVLPQHFTRR